MFVQCALYKQGQPSTCYPDTRAAIQLGLQFLQLFLLQYPVHFLIQLRGKTCTFAYIWLCSCLKLILEQINRLSSNFITALTFISISSTGASLCRSRYSYPPIHTACTSQPNLLGILCLPGIYFSAASASYDAEYQGP